MRLKIISLIVLVSGSAFAGCGAGVDATTAQQISSQLKSCQAGAQTDADMSACDNQAAASCDSANGGATNFSPSLTPNGGIQIPTSSSNAYADLQKDPNEKPEGISAWQQNCISKGFSEAADCNAAAGIWKSTGGQ